MQGMAFEQTDRGEPECLEKRIFLKCLQGVSATGGLEAADRGKHGGNERAIAFQQEQGATIKQPWHGFRRADDVR
jgi:hypothetical protein